VYEIIKNMDDMYRVKILKENEVASEIKIICDSSKEA
jgi:hypothetical protein